jgi:DNA polymerase-3 subunit delta
MVAVKAHEADRALASLDKAVRVVLFFGPDQGLVSERAAALAEKSVTDSSDPFQLVRIDGADLAADPARLMDEASTIGLFGGQRAIRVSATGKPLGAAVEPLLKTPPVDAIVILEGGDLSRTNGLRTMIEKARTGLAVPCYADQGRGLEALIDPVLSDHGLSIDRDARTLLLSRLGADRQLSRREIEKLALYALGSGKIERHHVDAIVGDASAREIDDVVDGVFCGMLGRLDQAFTRLNAAGEDSGTLIGFVIRHAQALLVARQGIDAGRSSAAEASASMRGVPFTRRKDIESALNRWSSDQLSKAIVALQGTMANVRRHPQLARQLATRALWNLTMSGGRG